MHPLPRDCAGLSEYDEAAAEDLILEAGANGAARRPTTSVYDREVARAMPAERGGLDMSRHSVFLMRGRDASGQNDFRLRPQRWGNRGRSAAGPARP
jgi:hypothetical protein